MIKIASVKPQIKHAQIELMIKVLEGIFAKPAIKGMKGLIAGVSLPIMIPPHPSDQKIPLLFLFDPSYFVRISFVLI